MCVVGVGKRRRVSHAFDIEYLSVECFSSFKVILILFYFLFFIFLIKREILENSFFLNNFN
jgi:hypothetical protein